VDFRYDDFCEALTKRQNERVNKDLGIIFSVEDIEGLYEKLSNKSVEFINRYETCLIGKNFMLQIRKVISLLFGRSTII